jgi:hypothetical protein
MDSPQIETHQERTDEKYQGLAVIPLDELEDSKALNPAKDKEIGNRHPDLVKFVSEQDTADFLLRFHLILLWAEAPRKLTSFFKEFDSVHPKELYLGVKGVHHLGYVAYIQDSLDMPHGFLPCVAFKRKGCGEVDVLHSHLFLLWANSP